jgi:putative oxidoreductase
MQYTPFQNAALFFLRLIIAAIFFVAGYYKFPFWSSVPEGMSATMVFITKLLSIAEPLGALALVLGLLTRWAAAGLSIVMLGAIYSIQFTMGIGFVTSTGPGWSFPLMILGGCIILVAFGPGTWALEKRPAATR